MAHGASLDTEQNTWAHPTVVTPPVGRFIKVACQSRVALALNSISDSPALLECLGAVMIEWVPTSDP